jgi:hypothetical protein
MSKEILDFSIQVDEQFDVHFSLFDFIFWPIDILLSAIK